MLAGAQYPRNRQKPDQKHFPRHVCNPVSIEMARISVRRHGPMVACVILLVSLVGGLLREDAKRLPTLFLSQKKPAII